MDSFDQFLVNHDISHDAYKIWCIDRDRSFKAGEKPEPLLVWANRMAHPEPEPEARRSRVPKTPKRIRERQLRPKSEPKPVYEKVVRPLRTECEMCHQPMTPQRISALYCSARCGRQHSRIHTKKPKPIRERVVRPVRTECNMCHQPMTPQRMSALYCSAKCRQRKFDARTRGTKTPAEFACRRIVITPEGKFEGVADAAHHYNIKQGAAQQRINRGTMGWRYETVDTSVVEA